MVSKEVYWYFADDIQVRFVEQDDDGKTIWEAFGNFGPFDVHRQVSNRQSVALGICSWFVFIHECVSLCVSLDFAVRYSV